MDVAEWMLNITRGNEDLAILLIVLVFWNIANSFILFLAVGGLNRLRADVTEIWHRRY